MVAGSGLRVVAALALLGAASCDAIRGRVGGGDGEGDATEAPAPADGLGPGDVEAPDLFRVAAEGLWDGRPSLGGTWVAHPDVTDPQRVLVRNADTGATVIGALFRREREAPGPALQVSSDAAEALGMLAGDPAALEVVALRREEPTADDAPGPAASGPQAEEPPAEEEAPEPSAPEPVAVETLPAEAEADPPAEGAADAAEP